MKKLITKPNANDHTQKQKHDDYTKSQINEILSSEKEGKIITSGITNNDNYVVEVEFPDSEKNNLIVFFDQKNNVLQYQDGPLWFTPTPLTDDDSFVKYLDTKIILDLIEKFEQDRIPTYESREEYLHAIQKYLEAEYSGEDQLKDVDYEYGVEYFNKKNNTIKMQNNTELLLTNADYDLINNENYIYSTDKWYANSKYFDKLVEDISDDKLGNEEDYENISFNYHSQNSLKNKQPDNIIIRLRGFSSNMSELLELKKDMKESLNYKHIPFLSRDFIEKHEDLVIKLIESGLQHMGTNITDVVKENAKGLVKNKTISSSYVLTKYLLQYSRNHFEFTDEEMYDICFDFIFNDSNTVENKKSILHIIAFETMRAYTKSHDKTGMNRIKTLLSPILEKPDIYMNEIKLFYRNNSRCNTGPMIIEELITKKYIDAAKELLDDMEGENSEETQKEFYKEQIKVYEQDRPYKTISLYH